MAPSRVNRPASGSGFTLVELLIYTALGGVIISAATSAVVSHIRSDISLERNQTMRNDLSRVVLFLSTEVSEADTISYGQTMPASCNGGTASLFTLNVPNLGFIGTTLASTPIHYYVTGSGTTASLNRCGPPFNPDGSLNYTGLTVNTVVSPNTTLTLANTTDTEAITYDLTVRDPSATQAVSRTNLVNSSQVSLIN